MRVVLLKQRKSQHVSENFLYIFTSTSTRSSIVCSPSRKVFGGAIALVFLFRFRVFVVHNCISLLPKTKKREPEYVTRPKRNNHRRESIRVTSVVIFVLFLKIFYLQSLQLLFILRKSYRLLVVAIPVTKNQRKSQRNVRGSDSVRWWWLLYSGFTILGNWRSVNV